MAEGKDSDRQRQQARGPLTTLAVARASDLGPDPLYDPVRLLFADLKELVVEISPLVGNQQCAVLPDEVPAERLVALAASFRVDTAEYTRRSLAAAEVIDDGIICN